MIWCIMDMSTFKSTLNDSLRTWRLSTDAWQLFFLIDPLFYLKRKAVWVVLDCVSKIDGWWLSLPHRSPLARITAVFLLLLLQAVSLQRETMVITQMESCKGTRSDLILISGFLGSQLWQEAIKFPETRPDFVSSDMLHYLCIIIPVECVAQRKKVNQSAQSDILLSVCVLAPAIDPASLYKCSGFEPWKVKSKLVVL